MSRVRILVGIFGALLSVISISAGHSQMSGSAREVKAAIDAGADVMAMDPSDGLGRTPLGYAASNNQDQWVIVALVSAGADPNVGDPNGSALKDAVEMNRNPAITAALIKAGADVNGIDKYHQDSVLSVAAQWNPNPAVIRALLDAGADVAHRTSSGWTPLMSAAAASANPEIVKTLIAGGSDFNAADNSGMTVLMIACSRNPNPLVVGALLDAGADPRAKNKKGYTAKDYAEVSRFLPGTDVYQRLITAVQSQ